MTSVPRNGDPDPGLLRRMDSRMRREMERAEQQAVALSARRRSLEDAAWEAVQSGSRVGVRAGDYETEGTAVYARRDLLSLETARGGVEVCLPNVDAVLVRPGGEPGRSVPREAESFAARLAVMHIYRERVEVIIRGGTSRFRGVLEATARDHLLLESPDAQILIPLPAVACVVRTRPPLPSRNP